MTPEERAKAWWDGLCSAKYADPVGDCAAAIRDAENDALERACSALDTLSSVPPVMTNECKRVIRLRKHVSS